MLIKREFLVWEGDMYELLRSIRESHNPVIDAWKEHLGADKVLRKGEFLFFYKKVEEAVIVTDEPINDTKTENNEQIH